MGVPMGPWLVGFRGQIIPLFIVGDVISDNWDGLIPPNLSGTDPDLTATQGYALDASAGSAQFNGRLFIQGELKVGENADVFIGGPGSTDAQLFIDNTLQHINLRETDDPSYPDIVWIHDVNSGVARLIRLDASGPTFTAIMLYDQQGFVDINQPAGGLLRAGLPAYTYKETLQYTGSGSFAKGDYDGCRAIHYRIVAGGGGSGGAAATGAGQVSGGGNGGGGEYCEGFILASDLAASEAVTVGAGGANGAAGNNAGGTGGDSVIDTISGEVRANGGLGGGGGAATVALTGVMGNAAAGGSGGGGSGAYLVIAGDDAEQSFCLANNRFYPGSGGRSAMGPNQSRATAGGNYAAVAGRLYGGGAMGGGNDPSQAAIAGADGATGLVLIDVLT